MCLTKPSKRAAEKTNSHAPCTFLIATWLTPSSVANGKITLEIVNLGPFDIVLEENDVIAQLTVAKVTSAPKTAVTVSSATFGQTDVGGR